MNMKKLIVILTACAVFTAPASMMAFANESDNEWVVIECTAERTEEQPEETIIECTVERNEEQPKGTIIECTVERNEEQPEETIIECTIERNEEQDLGLLEPESGNEQAITSSAADFPVEETHKDLSHKDENDMAENTAEWMGSGDNYGLSAAMNDCYSAFVNDGYSSEIALYKAKLETMIEYGYALPYDTATDTYVMVSNYDFP